MSAVTADGLAESLDRSVWRGTRILMMSVRPDLPPGDRTAAIALEPGPCSWVGRAEETSCDVMLGHATHVAVDMAARAGISYVVSVGSRAGRGWAATTSPDGAWSGWRPL